MISTRKLFWNCLCFHLNSLLLKFLVQNSKRRQKNIKNLTQHFKWFDVVYPKHIHITGSTCSATIRNDDDVFNEAWQKRPNKRANKCLTGRELNSSSPQWSLKWKICLISNVHTNNLKAKVPNKVFGPNSAVYLKIALFLDF